MGKGLLVIVVGFSTIFSGMMYKMTTTQQLSSRAIVNQYEKSVARNATESAANAAASKLYRDFDWRSGYSDLSFIGADYSVSVSDVTVDSSTEAKKVQVKAIATYEGATDSTVAVYMRPAYSYFFYMVHNWPWFITYNSGDTLGGPVHANSQIRISNSPVFIARVSSDETSYAGISSPNPKFYGGADFGTQTISMPNLAPLVDSTMAGGDVYSDEVWLTFNADGSYDYLTAGGSSGTKLISDYNGTLMTISGNDIHAQGTVDGKITIVSDANLFIGDDLVYASDPRDNPDSDDFVGLIARDNVIIEDTVPNAIDVEIHGALMAHGGTFAVEDLDIFTPNKGTLTILGSIAQVNASSYGFWFFGFHGYAGEHVYDQRLFDKTPPYYPRLDRVEVVSRSN